MNVAFLIDKGQEKEFDGTLNQLEDCYGGRIHFRCVGPLPPYSFSTVEAKRVKPEAIEKARELLGVAERATLPEVKKAYRRLAQKYHPDKNPGGQDERFRELASAYRLLNVCGRSDWGSCPGAKDLIVIEILG